MTENREKLDELITKLKALGDRAKTTRAQFGSPIMDTILARANKNLARFGDGDGVQRQPPQQPQLEMRRSCPKCGLQTVQEAQFCSDCGFSYRAQEIEERHRREDRERLERNSRASISS